ncbi:hypothetical protein BR141012304_20406 [Brucella inopinata]|nr:hypothetical protein BR141012304_20406 [Brucella inopinata]
MIYPIHDQYGARIGTVMTEEGNPPQERWVAYTLHGERKAFASWDAAQQWVGETASHPVRNDSPQPDVLAFALLWSWRRFFISLVK